jgi:response regulator RpfG family c-di-GMP phosphodiesterase
MTTAVEKPRILLVDDEPNLLDGLRRQLRRDFTVETAVGAANGLFALKPDDPFAVIVSDFLMPGINGAEFLAAAAKAAPTSTRMLLTGHTSLADAAVTVNQGRVFRMLLKPVDTDTMTAALRDCVTQHKLIVSERELLERTLQGSVKALSDVLSLASPTAFGRAARMRRVASAILDRVEVEDRWAAELAVEMAQLGIVSLPPTVAAKLDTGEELTPAEQEMVDQLPTVAQQLISPIPRMAQVAEAIHYSRKGFDGSGTPGDSVAGDRIPFGGRLLRLVQDHDAMLMQGMSPTIALATLQTTARLYDPALLEAFSATAAASVGAIRGVMLDELQSGMVLAAPVCNNSHVLLVNAGQEVTVGLITRLRNFAALEEGVAEPLMILDDHGVSADAATAPDATAG